MEIQQQLPHPTQHMNTGDIIQMDAPEFDPDIDGGPPTKEHEEIQGSDSSIQHLLGESKKSKAPALEITDYFFTNIEPTLIKVECPAAHQNKSTSQQPVNRDTVSQQTHPQQPEETRIHSSMLINRQVPVLNLTETNITSHADLQDAFNSLCVCSHGGREDTQDQNTE